MIDLHTHILPGIDDGAADEGVSAEQLESLAAQGVDKVVFTSHYYGRKRSPRQFLEARAAAFEQIKGSVPRGTEACLGAEVHFSLQTAASNEALCSLAIGDTRYMLTELPFASDWNRGLWRRLEDFIADTDYVPVIAHVERYDEARKKPALLSELVEMGCLLQVNTRAFLEKSTKGMAFALLDHGLVHCLGTDTHNLDDRAPVYAEAKEAIEEAGFGDRFERIQENMAALLEDERIKAERAKPVRRFLTRYY